MTYTAGQLLAISLFEKTAVTRAVEEIRALLTARKFRQAEAIAKAHSDLGLKPRYVKDLGSGSESLVDLLMGKAPVGEGGGLIARKLHKPNSTITRGTDTSKLLDQKMLANTQMRQLSPEATRMVPEMYGYETRKLDRPRVYPLAANNLRHLSYSEFVPGVKSIIPKGPRTPVKRQQVRETLKDVISTVQNPMQKQHGTIVGDTVDSGPLPAQLLPRFNSGNIIKDYKGNTKIVDFIPFSSRLKTLKTTPLGQTRQKLVSLMRQTPAQGFKENNYKDTWDKIPNLRKEIFTKSKPITNV